jgi:hypothetical protein
MVGLEADDEILEELNDFALNYTPEDRDDFAFQWNGKESENFEDENEDIRGYLAAWVLKNPERAPLDLIRDILFEDILCAQQAWRTPDHTHKLLAILTRRGGATPELLSQLRELG